jgi:hypothetical protein
MRTRTAIALIASGLLASLTACSSDPTYTIVDERDSSSMRITYLQLPDATHAQAEEAIRDYAGTIEGPKWATISLHSDPADGDVCRGTWVKDPKTAQQLSGGSFKSDTWPALQVQCP